MHGQALPLDAKQKQHTSAVLQPHLHFDTLSRARGVWSIPTYQFETGEMQSETIIIQNEWLVAKQNT